MRKIADFMKKEVVLTISIFLAIISCFFVKPSVQYINYIDFKVLTCLFCLMILVGGLIKMNILDIIAQKLLKMANSLRTIYIIIIFLTFVSAMLITNDVALITFVPLTLTILKMCDKKENIILFIVMQTIAANLGSSLTPVGNPQNLYLFSFYNLGVADFFSATVPMTALSGLLLFICALFIKKESIKINIVSSIKIKDKTSSVIYGMLFILTVLSVFDIVKYYIVLSVIIIMFLILDRNLFKEVDYSLLMTFVGFFIFVGNISNIESLKVIFSDILNGKELITSILLSQIISNVPAAMLLSNFTDSAKEILLGVNIGGLGTLIASLASVISFKIYSKEEKADKTKYMKIFSMMNIAFLIVLTIIFMV